MIKHLALIMDGNRRWAKKNSMLPWLGHQEGAKVIEEVVDFCLDNSIKYLTLYAFSTENLKRPEPEKKYLFKLIKDFAQDSFIDISIKKDMRVRFIGERDFFPVDIKEVAEKIENYTLHCKTITVNILFCYGGQQELVSAINKTIASNSAITYQDFRKNTWLGDCPEPELIIRTGGHKRLSNFMLAHCAYSELYFLDEFWPEIRSSHLQEVLDDYSQVKRNFGA